LQEIGNLSETQRLAVDTRTKLALRASAGVERVRLCEKTHPEFRKKDPFFAHRAITVRDGKGAKDRMLAPKPHRAFCGNVCSG
jgi:hypothetical protein